MGRMKKDGAGDKALTEELGQSTVAPTVDNYSESLIRSHAEPANLHIVSFFLGSDEYAVEVTDAAEVLKPRAFTEVPRTPEFMLGIVSVRGEMVPVMDLKKRLGVGSAAVTGASRILVVASEDLKAGFLVDRMIAVADVPAVFAAPGGEAPSRQAAFSRGVIERGGKAVLLLDVPGLLDFAVKTP